MHDQQPSLTNHDSLSLTIIIHHELSVTSHYPLLSTIMDILLSIILNILPTIYLYQPPITILNHYLLSLMIITHHYQLYYLHQPWSFINSKHFLIAWDWSPEPGGSRTALEDFETYCAVHGEGIVASPRGIRWMSGQRFRPGSLARLPLGQLLNTRDNRPAW